MLLTELRQLGTQAMFFFIRHRIGPTLNGRTKSRVLGFPRSPAKRHKKAFLNTCLR